ncbi:hypothetical protein Xbed_03624 [Xenorhabdus beddingii]|uniref:Uncharacterized protein n=1 Tax=Xenorhabdus beddingii TaxID=40578 RepID=A0A1Y2SAP8_9GAMM|nr:hypothetical protein Xbed_03624 [Xenorhabdus beddingii]
MTTLQDLLDYYKIQAWRSATKYVQNIKKRRKDGCGIDDTFTIITAHKHKNYPRGSAFQKMLEIENKAKQLKFNKLHTAIQAWNQRANNNAKNSNSTTE